jgi:hypothetical protein
MLYGDNGFGQLSDIKTFEQKKVENGSFAAQLHQ